MTQELLSWGLHQFYDAVKNDYLFRDQLARKQSRRHDRDEEAGQVDSPPGLGVVLDTKKSVWPGTACTPRGGGQGIGDCLVLRL